MRYDILITEAKIIRDPGRGEIIDDATPVPAVGELGGPDRILSPPELTTWIEGRRLFDHDFHMDEGLGPIRRKACCNRPQPRKT